MKRSEPDIYKSLIFNDSDEIENKLPYHRSFQTFWNISGGLWTKTFDCLNIGDLK